MLVVVIVVIFEHNTWGIVGGGVFKKPATSNWSPESSWRGKGGVDNHRSVGAGDYSEQFFTVLQCNRLLSRVGSTIINLGSSRLSR